MVVNNQQATVESNDGDKLLCRSQHRNHMSSIDMLLNCLSPCMQMTGERQSVGPPGAQRKTATPRLISQILGSGRRQAAATWARAYQRLTRNRSNGFWSNDFKLSSALRNGLPFSIRSWARTRASSSTRRVSSLSQGYCYSGWPCFVRRHTLGISKGRPHIRLLSHFQLGRFNQ